MEIGEYCKRWRKSQGISQKKIAEATGLSIMSVSMFENGISLSGKVLLSYILSGMDINSRWITYGKKKAYSEAAAHCEREGESGTCGV